MTTSSYSQIVNADEKVYRAPVASGPVSADLHIPGSKSLTNRELILSAIADGASTLVGPLHSDDSRHMITALRALGVEITELESSRGFGPDLRIVPRTKLRGNVTIDCGQAGTVMRFVTPLAGRSDGPVQITAAENALHRPMGTMIQALRDLGIDVDDQGSWSLPFTVHGHGHVRGGRLEIDASDSSQFISGLLLAAPRFDIGLHLVHTGEKLPSVPHIDMTIETLSKRGVHVQRPAPGEWLVEAGVPRGKTVSIEPDLSNAAPFLASALVSGGEVTIADWPVHSTQPGAMLPQILSSMGAHTSRRGGALTVRGGRHLRGINIDLSEASELTPTIVALAAFAETPSTITGVGHIRGHETDRLAALVNNLANVGVRAEELPDGIRVFPVSDAAPGHGGPWAAYHDHRIATTGAIIGLRIAGVEIDDITTTAKTLPEFTRLWAETIATGGSGS